MMSVLFLQFLPTSEIAAVAITIRSILHNDAKKCQICCCETAFDEDVLADKEQCVV